MKKNSVSELLESKSFNFLSVCGSNKSSFPIIQIYLPSAIDTVLIAFKANPKFFFVSIKFNFKKSFVFFYY